MTTRPDLNALRIARDDEDEARVSLGKIAGWVLALAALGAIAWAVYTRVVVPRRAPVVESVVVKPSINVANPALLSATGYLVANRQSKITPKISGKVVKLNFDVGDKVHAGDVLAVLESTNVKAQLDEAQATLNEAEREYTRQSNLWRQGVASRAGYDAAEAQVKAARARVDQIRINMRDMAVRAPFDGTIATKSTEVGEVISSVMIGQVAGTLPAGAICTIVDLNTLEVEADVNEGSIGQLHEGQPAEVTVDAFPGKKWRGVLRQIIPTADRAKATVKVKVKILDPGERLLPEMSATANFLTSERTDAELHEPPKLWVPKRAVTDGKVAVIGADNRVQLRAVQIGDTRESLVEVRSGLREGERIVTDGVEQLRNGELVRTGEN